MDLFECICDVIKAKEDAGIFPTHALMWRDLVRIMDCDWKGVENGLKELEEAGRIKTGNTINDRFVRIVENGQTNN